MTAPIPPASLHRAVSDAVVFANSGPVDDVQRRQERAWCHLAGALSVLLGVDRRALVAADGVVAVDERGAA